MPRSPLVGRALASRRTLAAVVPAALLLVLASCSGATEPGQPKVASITLSPALAPIVKGSTSTLTAVVLDSMGGEIHGRVLWSTSAPAVASVSETGVVTGVGYGNATITASVPIAPAQQLTASAGVMITAPPITSAYSVRELTPALTSHSPDQINDNGDVLARDAGLVYRDGIGSPIPGCNDPVTLNNRSHVLCVVGAATNANGYAIWDGTSFVPLAASDSFAAQNFRAFTLNDSDAVAGLYYQPAFNNPACPPSNEVRCTVIWERGQPTFPGLMIYPSGDITHLNNRLQLVSQQSIFSPLTPYSPFIYDAKSGQQQPVTEFVRAINDSGWAAIETMSVRHGDGGVVSYAQISRPDSSIDLGRGSATGINNHGVVVGTFPLGPFLWREGAVSLLTHAATDPSWTIASAEKINNGGQILAKADNADGRQGLWVILTPVAH